MIPDLFRTPYDQDDRKLTTVRIEERFTDWDENPDEEVVEYDRRWFFPLTAWLQDHRGERVTHKLYKEFSQLRTDVKGEYLLNGTVVDDKNVRMNISDTLLRPCSGTILHLWDVQGCLQNWLVQRMCKILVGRRSPESLPKPDNDARSREMEFRGGPSSVEMAAANLDSGILGGKKAYDEDDIDEAQDSNQGFVDYKFNLEKYKRLYPTKDT